ncbi:MAG TPA: ABC transporter ATP-binding protein/permease, partial [Geminocystis sp. M7585_C2015_104]|nr:ABC transporter ATP-binding protein/permease [Geminocystis sp. M7585_C2015_104]
IPIEPGQLVALVGGSGAGKSTLLRTLLGIQPITSGVVYLNGEDLTTNFNLYRHQIGYVPQTDIVHRDLRVEEVLRYAAKLRLPPDADVDAIVEKTLADIEMLERRDVLVKNLSGGQLKRVSIGVELLVNPKLFFLDEPTSGLDPGLDKKMMLLLRKLADQGRTIIIVTHATTNIKLCDRIVFLGRGGNLCFYGSYEEAREFFGLEDNKDFADVYLELDSPEAVKQTAERYQQSPHYAKNIAQKLSALPETRCQKPKPRAIKAGFWRQLVHLCQRSLQLVLRDRSNLIISLLTAPIGILLIRLATRDIQPFLPGKEGDATVATLAQTVVFVFTCAAIWVGLASSLQEIVKENDIYSRERLVNLNLLSYLGSKITILSALAGLQTLLMVVVTLVAFSPPKPEMISWWLGLTVTTFLSIVASICLGLMVSALVKNTTQANSALPLLLLPQIIFSGVLFEAKGIVEYVSWLMASRWSVGAYGSLVDINSLIPPPVRLPSGEEVATPFTEKYMYTPTWENLTANWEMLLVHCGIYLVITYLAQRRKDII